MLGFYTRTFTWNVRFHCSACKFKYGCDTKTALLKMFCPCLITMHITQCEIITERGFSCSWRKWFASWTEAKQKHNCERLSDRILHVDSQWRYNAKWAGSPEKRHKISASFCIRASWRVMSAGWPIRGREFIVTYRKANASKLHAVFSVRKKRLKAKPFQRRVGRENRTRIAEVTIV